MSTKNSQILSSRNLFFFFIGVVFSLFALSLFAFKPPQSSEIGRYSFVLTSNSSYDMYLLDTSTGEVSQIGSSEIINKR
jgi:hypothetical protein